MACIAGLLGIGREVRGFDLLIAGDLPAGAGLSSSAALEVGTATSARRSAGFSLDARDKAAALSASRARLSPASPAASWTSSP